MGARLRERNIHPGLVLSSPALRAEATAKLVAREIDYAQGAIRTDPRLYLAAAAEILNVVAEQSDAIDCVLVVGHNPGFTDLTNLLLPELDLANLPTAGTVVLDCAIERWAEIRHSRQSLVVYDYPKNPSVIAD